MQPEIKKRRSRKEKKQEALDKQSTLNDASLSLQTASKPPL